MNRSQIIYRLWKTVLLLVSGAVLSSGVAWAQTAADLTIKATASNAECDTDGKVTIEVVPKPGVAHRIKTLTYDLRNDKGKSVAAADGQYITTNVIGNLQEGTYKAYARVIFENSVQVDLGPVTVSVKSNYTPPTVAVTLERKTLKSYKEKGVRVPTGIISVRVSGKVEADTYTLKLVEAPASYKGDKEFTVQSRKRLYFYNLDAGTYSFQVTDKCKKTTEKQSVIMEMVASDAPRGGEKLVLPYDDRPFASDDTRWACRWFFLSYKPRALSEYDSNDKDLLPYLSPIGKNLSVKEDDVSPLDTITKYYNYGFAYGNSKPDRYYSANSATGDVNLFKNAATSGIAASKTDGEKGMEYLYSRIPEANSWDDAGYEDEMNRGVFPALFLRVKGSSDEMPAGYVPKRYFKGDEFTTQWKTLTEDCVVKYTLHVRPANRQDESNVLFCYPIKVRLYEFDKVTPLSEEITLSTKSGETRAEFKNLEGGKTYWVKGTDGSGAKVEYDVRLENKFEYVGKVEFNNKELDVCKQLRKSSIEIRRQHPVGVKFLKHKVTLIDAPSGYRPEEDGLALNVPVQFPDTFISSVEGGKDDRFYPFGKKSEWFRKPRYIFAPAGDYKFKIVDLCSQEHIVVVSIGERDVKTAKWTVKKENFAPRLVNADCGKIRIYPFTKENKTNFMFKEFFLEKKPAPGPDVFHDLPQPRYEDLMIYISKLPEDVEFNEVSHNLVRDPWTWAVHRALWPRPQPMGLEQLYFELPKTNGKIKLKVAAFSDSWEYDRVFTGLECLPEFELDLANILLSYDRDSYIGYRCPDKRTGRLFIIPTNNVGAVEIKLYYEGDADPFQTVTLAEDKVKEGVALNLEAPVGKTLPGKIRAILKDLKCDNYNEETLFIYDLLSPDMIKTPDGQRKYCEGDKIELSIMNLGDGVDYTWILPNGDISKGQKIVISKAETKKHSGQYTLKITNVLCGGGPSSGEIHFSLSVAPRELWWRKDAQDADWHNLNNWARRDGTPVQAVPAPCTTVHIPATVDKAFPDLAGEVTKRDIYGAPECNDIYFHYGAQLGTPQQLSYEKAFVDYNFGMNQPQGSKIYTPYVQQGHPQANDKLLDRNRWYMIAIPLKEVPAGDFGLGGHPRSYQRYLKVSMQGALNDASFVKPFNSYSESLNNHNNAMALKVAGSTPAVPLDADKEKYLNAARGIIRLPLLYEQDRFEGVERFSAYRDFALQQKNSQILFTYYNERTLELTNRQELHNRVLPDAFRFVFEKNNPGESGRIGNVSINGGTLTEGYTLAPKPEGGVGDWIMLGNPFMTPMDFDKFYEVNQDKIEPYYYLFTNDKWVLYTKGTAAFSGVAKQIAPLQSIVVKRKAVGDFLFPTSGAKSVLLPSWRTDQPDRYSVKSSEEVTVAETPLTINVANREGDYSRAFLGWSDEVSAPVFVNSEYASMPTVFLVEPDAGDYNAITYPKRAHGTINLGVASSLSSPLTLSFDHIDRSVYEELTLVDKHEGVEQDLLSNPQYDFIHKPDTTPATRFALRIKRFGITNVTSSDEMPIAEFKMFYRAGSLRVESPDALHRVVVYDMQGKTLADEVLTDNATRTVEVDTNNAHGVVVVEVFFKNGMRTVRKYDLR